MSDDLARTNTFYQSIVEQYQSYYWDVGRALPSVDVPLLRKAVEWVETESLKPVRERRWVQLWWRVAVLKKVEGEGEERCGTAFCLAGYIAELDPAFEWMSNAAEEDSSGYMQDMPWLRRMDAEGHISGSGELTSARSRAQELLGVTRWEAEALFSEGNSAEMIRSIAEMICRSRGEELGL